MRYRGVVDIVSQDIAIAASTTHTVADAEQVALNVGGIDTFTVSIKLTGGDASASGNIDFAFAGYDGTNWDTVAFSTKSVAMNGTTPVVQSFDVTVGSREKIKLLYITNNDANYPVTVNYVKALIKE